MPSLLSLRNQWISPPLRAVPECLLRDTRGPGLAVHRQAVDYGRKIYVFLIWLLLLAAIAAIVFFAGFAALYMAGDVESAQADDCGYGFCWY